jgi:hypothetical protein
MKQELPEAVKAEIRLALMKVHKTLEKEAPDALKTHGKKLHDHVVQIVERHVIACTNLDVPVENLARVIIEAAEDFEQEQRQTVRSVLHVEAYPEGSGPFMRYEQYRSPRGDYA